MAGLQTGDLIDFDYSGLYNVVRRILHTYTNKPIHTNITKSEYLALENLKKGKYHIIVTSDKGVALVVIDKTEYITKCEPSYKTTQFTNISPKTHLQPFTKNLLKFCKTTRITISSLKQNTPN